MARSAIPVKPVKPVKRQSRAGSGSGAEQTV